MPIRTIAARRPMSFDEALKFHPMILPSTAEFITRFPNIKRAVDCPPLVDLWDGLCGTADVATSKTCFANAVEFTIPIDYVPLIRRASGTTAAFAYCELAKACRHVRDLTDDLEVRAAMAKGWREFEQRRQEANAVREGFGCDDSQSWLTLRDIGNDPKSQGLKDKMMAIAKLAGRMFEHFGYQRRDQPNRDPEEVTATTLGGHVERLLPTELALLADPDTQDAEAMKILQKQAPELEMTGREAKTRGPLVLTIDESGSMHDGDLGLHHIAGNRLWGGRNTWAKACCVALTRIAWAENRPVVAVHFGTSTEVQPVPKDDMRAMFEMARMFLSGGTSFGAALARAQVCVGDLAADGYEGADILLITDGIDHDHRYHNQEIDRMDAAGIRLWTVAIGEAIPRDHPVHARAERYTFAHDRDLASTKTAETLATGLDKAAMGNDLNLN